MDMLSWQTKLARQLEELHLVQCSLLPGERFAFVLPQEDLAIWSSLLEAFTDAGGVNDDDGLITSLAHDPPCQARFEVRVVGAQTWFEVTLPRCTDATAASLTISAKGEHVSRETHERWTAEINARMAEMIDEACPFPAYEVLTQLTAALHQSHTGTGTTSPAPSVRAPTPTATSVPVPVPAPAPALAPQPPYHALLTSHHLVSPTKRRTMHHLSSQLGVAGFAKVGYPGIIYAEGPREAVEAFVREVKRMQWLALRVRFVEPVSNSRSDLGSGFGADVGASRDRLGGARWVEVSKVGEVLEWMRIRGRESLVTDLGIGAPSREPKR